MFVYVISFFLSMVAGLRYGKKFANKKVVSYAVKAGCSPEQAGLIYHFLQNGRKLEKKAKKEAEEAFKNSLVNEHLDNMKKGV